MKISENPQSSQISSEIFLLLLIQSFVSQYGSHNRGQPCSLHSLVLREAGKKFFFFSGPTTKRGVGEASIYVSISMGGGGKGLASKKIEKKIIYTFFYDFVPNRK